MSLLDSLHPTEQQRVYDLVKDAGLDVSEWANYNKPDSPASNPKYCYEWCFTDSQRVVLCLWHQEMKQDERGIFQMLNYRDMAAMRRLWNPVQRKRARNLDLAFQKAWNGKLPVRVIIIDGMRRGENDRTASKVAKRKLDPETWHIESYDDDGNCTIRRGHLVQTNLMPSTYNSFNQYLYEENKEGSGKANSYLNALHWLREMLIAAPSGFSDCIDIWSISSVDRIIELRKLVVNEQRKGDSSLWVRKDIPVSYLRDGYCSAALSQLIEFLPSHGHTQKVMLLFESHNDSESKIASKLNFDPELPVNIVQDPNSRDGQDQLRKVKTRIGQRAFREVILKIYENRCCVTGLDIPAVNRASHIIGWAERKNTRMDPRNGLCLSATYDAAFDKHLISLDEDFRLILSKDLKAYSTKESFRRHFANLNGKRIALPQSYLPKQEYLEEHRKAGSF